MRSTCLALFSLLLAIPACGDDTGGAGGSNGTSTSAFFNRRSTVSLMGNFGEIRLGRDYVPTYWNTTLFDPYGTVGVGGSSNIYSDSGYGTLTAAGKTPSMGTGAITALRDNNAVQYFLPAGLGGIYGQAMVAAGEGGTGGKYYGARVGWASGPIDVAIAWGRNPRTGAMLDDMTLWNVGGSYDFGVAKIMAIYNDWEGAIAGFDGIGPNMGWTQKNWLVGAYVPFGPGRFSASYSQTKRELLDGSKPKVDQIAVGYVYELSKRTALYGTYSHVSNDDGLAFTAGADGPAFTETGRTSSGAEIGIRHTF
jgi:predicted porin